MFHIFTPFVISEWLTGLVHVQHWSCDYELALTSQSYFYVRLLFQENIAEDAGKEN